MFSPDPSSSAPSPFGAPVSSPCSSSVLLSPCSSWGIHPFSPVSVPSCHSPSPAAGLLPAISGSNGSANASTHREKTRITASRYETIRFILLSSLCFASQRFTHPRAANSRNYKNGMSVLSQQYGNACFHNSKPLVLSFRDSMTSIHELKKNDNSFFNFLRYFSYIAPGQKIMAFRNCL